MNNSNIIKVKTAADIFAAGHQSSEPLWGRFIHKGELAVLFGDSNTGKSILANDIAFFVAGKGHEWFGMESPNIPTLYFDMEMSESQFSSRYKNACGYIPGGYMRAEVDVMGTCGKADILSAIKTNIIMRQNDNNAPKFIIIDNITNGFGNITSATRMINLVSELKTLKDKFGLTILLLAHCPKRKQFSPITQDSLGGSKMLINFVDSAFAIAPSVHGEDIKYIKQIKTRETQKMSNVMSVQIVNEPYLSFSHIGEVEEQYHLELYGYDLVKSKITPQKEVELVKMLVEGEMAYSEIARELGLSKMDVVDYAIQNNL